MDRCTAVITKRIVVPIAAPPSPLPIQQRVGLLKAPG